MTKEEAIRFIISDYCKIHKITPTQFARESGISKAYVSKIMKKKYGKVGISMTYTELIAKGMKMNMIDFQKLIEQYKEKNNSNNYNHDTDILIAQINNELYNLSKEDLEVIHSIIVNSDSEKLDILHNVLKNMK